MDETAHIIVAAELDNTAPDANGLLPMIQAVQDNLGELPALGLADAGYRSQDNLKNSPIEWVVALGREGKPHAEVDPQAHPHTAAMAAKCRPTKVGRHGASASGSPRRPTAGSGACWVSDRSACGGCTAWARSGSSCALH